MVTIPVSFMTLSLSSAKLFYSNRLGIFPDPDPPFLDVLFVLPVIIWLIAGPLWSIILMAAYFQVYAVLAIALILLANYLTLKNIYLREGSMLKDVLELYNHRNDDTLDTAREEHGLEDMNLKFSWAVFTSFVSPCTVWINNLTKKSYFLLVSSFVTNICHFYGVLFLFVFVHALDDSGSNFCQNILTCIKATENNSLPITHNIINLCHEKDTCLPVVRICSSHEQPYDLFTYLLGPVAFALLIISFLASCVLQQLGSYLTMYRWSKRLSPKFSIIHPSLLHEFLKKSKVLSDELVSELRKALYEAVEKDEKILCHKEVLSGDTLLHSAVDGCRFEVLQKMSKYSDCFFIRNSFGQTVYDMVESMLPSQDGQGLQIHLKIILEMVAAKRPENFKLCPDKVWEMDPMIESVIMNNMYKLCFLAAIGGHWGAENEYSTPSMNYLILYIDNGKIIFEKLCFLVRWTIRRAVDGYGQTIIHNSAKLGRARCLKSLVKNSVCVNLPKVDDGRTPLCFAVQFNHVECTRVLIQHGADVNWACFNRERPLHFAAQYGSADCTKLLLDNGANIEAKNGKQTTPLLQAVTHANPDCLQVLLDNNAETKIIGAGNSHLLHMVGDDLVSMSADAEERTERCCQLLVDAGADLNVQDQHNGTPLIRHSIMQRVGLAKLLVLSGADVNIRDDRHRTALHYAASLGQPDYIHLLIDRGAEVNATDFEGQTPLHFFGLSSSGAHDQVESSLRVFVQAGADFKARNKSLARPINLPKIILLLNRNHEILFEAFRRDPEFCQNFQSYAEELIEAEKSRKK